MSSVSDPADSCQAPSDPIPQVLQNGFICLLASASGTGKTALLAGLLRQLCEGRPIFGHPVNAPPKVAILTVDRAWEGSTGVWFERAGYPEILHYSLQDDDEFPKIKLRNRFGRIQIFKDCLEKLGDLPPGSLVAVDTIAPFLGGNLNDYDACMSACSELREIARKHKFAFWGTTHSSKQKADKRERYLRLQDRISGTMAQFGYTDTQMYLAAPDETNSAFYTFLWHPHLAPAETFRLKRDDQGLFLPIEAEDGVVAAVEDMDEFVANAQDYPWLPHFLDLLAGEIKTLDILQHLPEWKISRATLFRVLNELEKRGVVVQVNRGTWRKASKH